MPNDLKLLVISASQCKPRLHRSILIDEIKNCFVVRYQTGNETSNDIYHPFESNNKLDVFKMIIEHGKQSCFKNHKIYPKEGEFAQLFDLR